MPQHVTLAGGSELNLLVGHQARQPDRMQPQTAGPEPAAAARQGLVFFHFADVEGLPQFLHHFSGFQAGAAVGIGLAVVVQLDQFGVVVEPCRGCRRLLQQHHANREVGHHRRPHRGAFGQSREIAELVGRQACGADHRRHAVGNGGTGVLVDHRGMGEVDEDAARMLLAREAEAALEVRAQGHVEGGQPQALADVVTGAARCGVDGTHQQAVGGVLDRPHHLGAHATQGTGHHHGNGRIVHRRRRSAAASAVCP